MVCERNVLLQSLVNTFMCAPCAAAFRTVTVILILFFGFLAHAQDFPVRANLVLTPPYSLYLSDYSSPESNTIQAVIHLGDLERLTYKVKFRITIEGPGITLITKGTYHPPPVILEGGATEILSGYDLAGYFNPANLDFTGASRNDFVKKGSLPEGHYTFSVEVIDYFRGVTVSNMGMASAWIVLNDPPVINLPFRDEKLIATDPQNVLFSWTPRHSASPNAAFSSEYEFSLVEIYPADRDPEVAMRSLNPVFTTTTTATSYQLGISDPQLVPGRKYAFRVRAYDTQGRDLFKNDGYSETVGFTFGDACVTPTGISAAALDQSRIKVSWEPQDVHSAFNVRLRAEGSSTWSELTNHSQSLIVPGLKPGIKYEYQVQGTCGTLSGDYSASSFVTTNVSKQDAFSCGAFEPDFTLSTTQLSKELLPGDLIRTADFEITTTELKKNADRSYSGKGFAFMPWLNETAVAVKFSSILVNEDHRVYRGNVTTVYTLYSKDAWKIDLEKDQPVESPGHQNAIPPVDSIPVIVYDGVIESISIDTVSGSIIVRNADGSVSELERPENENGEAVASTITDSQGNAWTVGQDGTITRDAAAQAPDVASSEAEIDFEVEFSAHPAQLFGFDDGKELPAGTHEEVTVQNKTYRVPWKSVEAGAEDRVMATAVGKSDFPGTVGFRNSAGLVPSRSYDQGQKEIFVKGKEEGAAEAISAYSVVAGDSAKEIEVGRINVASYARLSNKLILVPVNDAAIPDAGEIEAEVNRIYAQAVADWTIEIAPAFQIEEPYITGLDSAESDWISGFNEKMKRFNRAYQWEKHIEDDAYYLFLIPGSGSARAGFMPFRRRFGYIFTENTSDFARTIAHELGHGAFRLAHTFEKFDLRRGATANLMDYGGGTELAKYQWDEVHDPQRMIGWLKDDDESGMEAMSEEDIADWWEKLPPYRKATEILVEHLTDTDVYQNVIEKCDSKSCIIRADLKISEDISYAMEITIPSDMDPHAMVRMLVFEYRVDLWDAFNVEAEDAWDELYHWWRKQNDDLAQQKGWQVSTLNFLADVITAPTLVPAVQGWLTGKHWRDGHTLSGWEQALAALDFLVAEEMVKGCITNFVVRVGTKTLRLLKIPQGTRSLISNAIENGYRFTAISETEFLLLTKEGAQLAKIINNNLVLIHDGKEMVINLSRRSTLLGRYFGGTKEFLLARFQKSKLFNMLDVVEWTKPTAPSATVTVSEASKNADEFWRFYNQKFIDEALENGDDIFFLSRPADLTNLFYGTSKAGEFFDKSGQIIDVLLTGNLNKDIQTLLSKNAFLTMYGREVIYIANKLGISVEELALKF